MTEDALGFKHDIAVGHAGEIIAHGAVQAGLLEPAPGAVADFLRVGEIVFEKLLQHLHGAQVRLVHDVVVIKIFVKVIAQFPVQLAPFGTVLDERLGKLADIVGRLHAGGLNEALAGFHHVADLQINDGADGEIAPAFVGQDTMRLLHGARGLRPDLDVPGQMTFRKQTGIKSVVEIVAVVGDFISEIGNLRFERGVFGDETFPLAGMVVSGLMFREAFQNFPRKIQAGKAGILFLQFLDDAETVEIVLKSAVAFHQAGKHHFALVTKRRMPEVVRERNGLGEIGVEAERAGNVPGTGGHFNRVREPRAEMIAGAAEKNLRLVFEPAEGARMNHAVTVALVLRAPDRRNFLVLATARVAAELGVRCEKLAFELFEFLAGARHG